jgi:hypothetical protein
MDHLLSQVELQYTLVMPDPSIGVDPIADLLALASLLLTLLMQRKNDALGIS